MQTVLVRTYASWSRIQQKDPFAYARKVLANHVIDRWRRPIRENADGELPERAMGGDFVDGVATNEWLMRALTGLSARERAIVVLRHYWDLSEADVAAELKVSIGTVKSTNSRALAKIRVAIEPPHRATCTTGQGS